MDEVDTVVVGAGVVGLAVARALALAGRDVLVLEAAPTIGTGTSSRNSEVIHAGLYYPKDSLKAKLCVRGNALLVDYCQRRGVAHRRCGKLIVATTAAQVDQLEHIRHQAQDNGVPDLTLLNQQEAQHLEPQLQCHAALRSGSTGIVDSHALMWSLHGDLEHAGGMLAFHASVTHMQATLGGIALYTRDGTALRARTVVNAAGLGAVDLASRIEGLDARHLPRAFFAKGNYFTLSGRAPFSHLIYPVPEAAGLGVHLTLDLAGQARFGPDVQWVDDAGDLTVDPQRGQAFYAAVRRYWPALQDGTLQPAYAGIRPKISGPGEAAADFLIQGPAAHGVPGLVNLLGIESPGLTSALAIGEHVRDLLAA